MFNKILEDEEKLNLLTREVKEMFKDDYKQFVRKYFDDLQPTEATTNYYLMENHIVPIRGMDHL